MIIERNILPAAIEEVADFVFFGGTAEIIGVLVGAFAPRIKVWMLYFLHKTEKSHGNLSFQYHEGFSVLVRKGVRRRIIQSAI